MIWDNTVSKRAGNVLLKKRDAGIVPSAARAGGRQGGRQGGRGERRGRWKRPFEFPSSMLPLLSSLLAYVFFLHSRRCGTGTRLPWRRPLVWGPRVSHDCVSVRALTPINRCARRLERHEHLETWHRPACQGTFLGCRLRMREIVRREGRDATWCRRRCSQITCALTLRDSPGDKLSRKQTMALSSASGVWVGVLLGRRERS